MIHNICSSAYTASANFGNKTIELSKSIASKTVEIARKTFDTMNQFFLGFCTGFLGLSGYLYIEAPLLAFSLHAATLAVIATTAGVCLGIALASQS